ncbi:uncharacterized protein [Nicotiana sylvestris]|uniref:uncharacterized protein n=1 Tax=Nicotiana sylvestris TaxID=4096 RepID=UPI00388CBB07
MPLVVEDAVEPSVRDNVRIDIHEVEEETQEAMNPYREYVIDMPEPVVPKAKAPLPRPPPTYPQWLAKQKGDNQFKKFIEMMKSLTINVPLVEALKQMPGYAKFIKYLVTKTRSMECETIKMTHQTFGIVQSRPTSMRLQMADRSMKRPLGIIDDVLVRVDKFILPADFVILDCEVDFEVPIILGRLFLTTGKALVDVEARELTFRVGDEKVDATLAVLQKRKRAIRGTLADIRGISPAFCMHKIILEKDARPSLEHQRRLNEAMQEVVKKEVIKWLDTGVVYPISDNSWTSPVQCILKKGGMTVVTNANNELIPTQTVTGWRVCMDYRKLNKVTRKDHFPLSFLDQMLDRLTGRSFYCFLDGYSGYNQILIAPED